MKANVTKVEEISPLIIPAGTYQGLWSGYQVIVDGKWRLTTDTGIRGINIPCNVAAFADGSVSVSTERRRSPKREVREIGSIGVHVLKMMP